MSSISNWWVGRRRPLPWRLQARCSLGFVFLGRRSSVSLAVATRRNGAKKRRLKNYLVRYNSLVSWRLIPVFVDWRLKARSLQNLLPSSWYQRVRTRRSLVQLRRSRSHLLLIVSAILLKLVERYSSHGDDGDARRAFAPCGGIPGHQRPGWSLADATLHPGRVAASD